MHTINTLAICRIKYALMLFNSVHVCFVVDKTIFAVASLGFQYVVQSSPNTHTDTNNRHVWLDG